MVHIFFDDGGVLNDNSKCGPKWWKHQGEWFIPRYGGTLEGWIRANIKALKLEMEHHDSMFLGARKPYTNYQDFRKEMDREWLITMFEEVGLEIPANVLEVVEESINYVAYRATAPYEDIIGVISYLYEKYGTLHTASNEDSIILNLYLSGMGVREKFRHLFGTDLVNIQKISPIYYERVFEITGFNPEECIFIDDKPKLIGIIRDLGSKAILTDFHKQGSDYTYTATTANEIPDLIKLIVED